MKCSGLPDRTGPDPDHREKCLIFHKFRTGWTALGIIILLAILPISYFSTNNRPASKREYDTYIRSKYLRLELSVANTFAAFVAKLSLLHVYPKCYQFQLTCSGHMTIPGRRGRPTFSLFLSSQLSGKPLLCTTEVCRMILCFLTISRISRPTLSETELHSNRRQKRSQTREQTT
jgi:hypothetical protein